jgi:hypothetical protein
MTTSTARRTIPPMRAEDLLFLLVEANRCLADPERVPDVPPNPDYLQTFHILLHPRFEPNNPIDENCQDCIDENR